MTSRRGFLLGLTTAFAAPAIVRAESLMKLWVPPAPKLIVLDDPWRTYLPGDLCNFVRGAVPREQQTMLSIGAVVVVSDNGGPTVTVLDHGFPGKPVEYPRFGLELFHGLKGNRVNNPSMKDRLIRRQGHFGLAYPEDLRI